MRGLDNIGQGLAIAGLLTQAEHDRSKADWLESIGDLDACAQGFVDSYRDSADGLDTRVKIRMMGIGWHKSDIDFDTGNHWI